MSGKTKNFNVITAARDFHQGKSLLPLSVTLKSSLNFLVSHLKEMSLSPNSNTFIIGEILILQCKNRFATAQGIWKSIFPDRENTGNLLKICFYTGNLPSTQGKFRVERKNMSLCY